LKKEKKRKLGVIKGEKVVWSTSMRGVGGCGKEASEVRKRDHKWAIGA
jgi:hypothetical protein